MWQEIRDWFQPTERAAGRTEMNEARGESDSEIAPPSSRREVSGPDSRPLRLSTLDRVDTEASAGGAVVGVAAPPDEAELLDFLASDLDPVPADPAFRERLRDELWEILEAARVERSKD